MISPRERATDLECGGNPDSSGDTALDRANHPKRRRRCTIPAHSKFLSIARFASSLHPHKLHPAVAERIDLTRRIGFKFNDLALTRDYFDADGLWLSEGRGNRLDIAKF